MSESEGTTGGQGAGQQGSESVEARERAKGAIGRFVSELGRGGTLFLDGRRDYLIVLVVAALGGLIGGRISLAAVALALLMVAAKLDALRDSGRAADGAVSEPIEREQNSARTSYDYGSA